MQTLASIARRSSISSAQNIIVSSPARRNIYKRLQVFYSTRKAQYPLSKNNQIEKEGLAEIRYSLARDNLKQYTNGDKNEALLEQALMDNSAALALKLDTKFFLQYLEILCAKGDYQRLIDEVNANIFVYNNNTSILEYRAYAFMRLKNFKKALDDTDYILKYSYNDDRVMDVEELYMHKIECEMELGEYESAFKTFKYCLKKGVIFDRLIMTLVEKLGNVEEALEALSTEISKHKEPSAELLLCRASLHLQQGHSGLALADYNAAPDSDRKKEYFIDYGNILAKEGRYQEEVAALLEGLKRSANTNDTASLDLKEYVVQKQFYLFQFHDAKKTASTIEPQELIRPPATRYLGESLLFTGEYKKAIQMFTRTIDEMEKKENEEEKEIVSEYSDIDVFEDSLLPTKYRSRLARAVAYVAIGDTKKALVDLQQLSFPDLAKQNLESLRQLASEAPDELSKDDYDNLALAGLYYNNGIHKRNNKQFSEAVEDFTNALDIKILDCFPFHILKLNILLARAACYEPLRRFSEVLTDCQNILDIFPSNNKKLLMLQQNCLTEVGRYEEVAAIVRRYHLEDPKDTVAPNLSIALAYSGTRPNYKKAYEELYLAPHQTTREWQKLLCEITHELYKAEENIAAVTNFLNRTDIEQADRGYMQLIRAENSVRILLKEKAKDTLDKTKKEAEVKKLVDRQIVEGILNDISSSIDMYPEGKEEALKLRARVFFSFTNRYDEAIRNYAALEDKMAANLGIAQCLKASGRTAEATDCLERLLKRTEKSEDGEIIAFRGSVLLQLGKYEAAIENFSRGIVDRQHDNEFVASCYQQRAEAYLQLGDTKQAEHDLKKAAETNPNKREEYTQKLELQFQGDETVCMATK